MRAIKYIGLYIGLSVFLALMWALFSYPDTPSTAGEWLWIFVLAIPAQIAFEFIGEVVWNNKATRFVEHETTKKPFSLVRIIYGVFFVAALFGLILGFHYIVKLF